MTIHEFGNLPAGATLQATDGATRYLRVDWVMRQELGGAPTYYCASLDWETTPAGRLAAKDAEIALLRGWVEDLRAQLAAAVPSVPPAVAAAGTGMSEHADSAEPPKPRSAGGRDKRTPCPECGKQVWPGSLKRHLAERHTDLGAALTMPPWPALQITEDLGDWRCAVCKGTAHARSLNQPDRCLRCAAHSPTNGNGHGVAP